MKIEFPEELERFTLDEANKIANKALVAIRDDRVRLTGSHSRHIAESIMIRAVVDIMSVVAAGAYSESGVPNPDDVKKAERRILEFLPTLMIDTLEHKGGVVIVDRTPEKEEPPGFPGRNDEKTV